MAVYTSGSGGFRALAEAIAADRDERLVTDLSGVDDEPVVYVAPPDELHADSLYWLQTRLFDRGVDDGTFSVITGYDAEEAADLYDSADAAADESNHCMILRRTPDELPDDGDADVYSSRDITVEDVRDLQESGLCSFGIRAGGWSIHLRLADGFLCGYPTSRDPADYDGRQPYCVEDGEMACPLDGELLHAEELDASHVFVASCASMIDNNVPRLPVHVGTGLLGGASSMIGSYYVGPSMPQETLLHYSLLRAGYDVVERCHILNKNADANELKCRPYVPFGRPDAGLSNPVESRHEVSVESDGDRAVISAEDVRGYVLDFSIPGRAVAGDGDRIFVRNLTDDYDGDPLYYVAFPDDDGIRVVVYSGGRLDEDRLRLAVSHAPVRSRERTVAYESLRNARRNRTLGMMTNKAANQTKNLQREVHNLPDHLLEERYHLDAHRDVADRIDRVYGHTEHVREELLDALGEKRFLLQRYTSSVLDSDVYATDVDCHTCGRRMFVKELADSTDTIHRAIGVCPRCGHVFDVPTEPGDRAPTYPVVSGDLMGVTADRTTMTVEFENDTGQPVDATYRACLQQHADPDVRETWFEPSRRTVELAPGERRAVEFEVDTGSMPENQYYVFAHVVANLDVYVGVAMLLVGEKGGRLPHNR